MVFIWIWWDSNGWDKSMNKSIYKITENHLVAVSKMKIDHIYIVLMNEIYCYSIRCYHESEIERFFIKWLNVNWLTDW